MEKQLISFGNYLLKTYGVMVYSGDGKNAPLYGREVSDADLCNWRDECPVKSEKEEIQSRWYIDDRVRVFLMPEDQSTFPGLLGVVRGVHFFSGKTKYDVELEFSGGWKSRVYNVDSVLVGPV